MEGAMNWLLSQASGLVIIISDLWVIYYLRAVLIYKNSKGSLV